jgi:6-phosphogluconate dehydrogenase
MTSSIPADDKLADIGLYGMGVMGQNLALNISSHGFAVSVSNRASSPKRVDEVVSKAEHEGGLPLKGYKDCAGFIKSLSKPRKIIILVPAGAAVDQTIESLTEHMEVRISISSNGTCQNTYSCSVVADQTYLV